jgi:3-dehydroquinate synthase
MLRLAVRAADGSPRPLLLGPGALDALPRVWRPAWHAAALVADRNVMRRYGARVLRILRRCTPHVLSCPVPAGETHKTRALKAAIEDRLLAAGLGRDTCLVAFGGGVTLDLAGFVAATYLRGIPHVLIPTTLLAQVDAAFGGKTGVNAPAGKNLVGAFHFPEAVLVDPQLLRTLPKAEWPGGLAEVVKHAVVGDPALFRLLERHAERLRSPGRLDPVALRRAVSVKLDVVAADPFERGRRAVLNFGHTVGHALEAASGHAVPHGLAVAVGMAVESDVAVATCGFPAAERDRLLALLERLGLPTVARLPFARLRRYLAVDKKNREGAVRLALPLRIGRMAGARSGWTLAANLAVLRAAWERRRTAMARA